MSTKNKRKQSIIHKLRNREISGTFENNVVFPHNKAKLLFGEIPPRMKFHLKSVIEDIGNHILMGMTQCGQFMLTYTFTMDHAQTNNRFTYGSSCFKYQLHWWRFTIGAPAVLVAEVQLFENQDIHDVLTIGIAQWPSVPNRILVYGQSFTAPQDVDDSEFRKLYITVTAMPSLNNCKDCISIKRSLQQDTTDNWDSGVNSRCLRHGLTVHTMFSVFPPYPPINLSVAVKDENRIIVNTGNCLHVLSIDLEETCEGFKSTEENIINEELHHRLGTTLSSKGYDYKVLVINHFNDNANEQLLANKNNKRFRSKNYKFRCLQNSDCDNQCENCKLDCDVRMSKRPKQSVPLSVTKEAWLRQLANKVYDFAESDDSCNLKFKWYRRRTIADKMYEFCSDDEEDTENIHPLSFHFGATRSLGIFRSNALYKGFTSGNAHKPSDIDLEDGDQASETSQNGEGTDFNDSHLSVASPVRCSLDSSNILNRDKCWIYENDPDSSSSKSNCSKLVGGPSQLNVTCDSVWLDWETTSLSPRSDVSYSTTGSGECSELKSDSARSFLENLPTMGSESYSPKCVSPLAVKCYPGCAPNKDRPKKDAPVLKKFFCNESNLKSVLKLHNCHSKNILAKDAKKPSVLKKTKRDILQDRCSVPDVSVRFERRYIEMDEEILSTITDIDDEDGVTGFHYALPLSVHGTGHAQMQMIANNKVEKLNVPCCVVRQDSLDIEQFSYKAAVIICKCQGYKFWFCNDYDIEIVDVCAMNGDIMAVVFMRINAEPIKPSGSQDQGPAKEPRQFFETRCLFIWNARSKTCWLEAYTPLIEDPPMMSLSDNSSTRKNWNPARTEAAKLKSLRLGFFDFALIRPIRCFEHLVLDNIRFGPSLEVIEDEFNMISFYRERDEMVIGLADDSADEYTVSDYESEPIISDSEDDGI